MGGSGGGGDAGGGGGGKARRRHWLHWVAGLALYGALFAAVHWLHWAVPAPVLAVDPDAPASFCAGNALKHVEALAALGVRNVGSVANEVEAPRYLLGVLAQLQEEAARVGAVLEVDRQQASGAFTLDFLTDFTSVYTNLTNVVARLSWPDSARHGVLVSAHFDSAWNSAGASDDLVQVGTMLEFARALLAGPALPVAVVFNFNGGEETLLQAAHGFITAHKWAQDCRVVINLEAAGVGGRELLFQTGPGNEWLVSKYLEAAPYPHANVIAQELFLAGIIPGETDYRIYRDHGKIPGFDAAFIMNGWAYHTDRDSVGKLRAYAGSVQRSGENYLETLKQVAVAPELDPTHPNVTTTATGVWTVGLANDQAGIFFDVLGLFTVSYSKQVAVSLHLGSTALLMLVGQSTSLKQLGIAAGAYARALQMSLLVVLSIALGLTYFGFSMSWFARPWMLLLLYSAPCLLFSIRVHRRMMLETQVSQHAVFLVGLVASGATMLALTLLGSGAAYLPFAWVIFPLVGWALAEQSPHAVRPLLQLLGFVVPLLLTGGIIMEVVLFFVPILGRGGTLVPPDLILGLVMLLVTTILMHPLIVVLVYLSGPLHPPQPKYMRVAMDMVQGTVFVSQVDSCTRFTNSLWVVSCIAIALAIRLPTYTQDCPKRLILQHTTRQMFDKNGGTVVQDAGIWINSMDFRHPLSAIKEAYSKSDAASLVTGLQPVTIARHRSAIGAQYSFLRSGEEVYVGDPIYTNNPWVFPIAHMFGNHMYMKTAPIEPVVPTQVTLMDSKVLHDPPRRRLRLKFEGADHMVWLFKEGLIHWWSLGRVTKTTNGAHFVIYINGLSTEEGHSDATRKGHFEVELEVLGTETPFQVVLVSHEFELGLSKEMKVLAGGLPEWTTESSWNSHWRSYVF